MTGMATKANVKKRHGVGKKSPFTSYSIFGTLLSRLVYAYKELMGPSPFSR